MRFDPISFLSRLLLFAVLITAVAVVGSKLWVNYQLNQQLERLEVALSPWGDLSWQGVYNTFGGEVGVRNLALLPDRGGAIPPVSIEQLSLQTNYKQVLSVAIQGLKEFPDELTFKADNVNINLIDLLSINQSQSLSGNPFETFACADVDEFIESELEAMGFYNDRVDVDLALERRGRDRLQLRLQQTSAEFASTRLQMDLDFVDGLMARPRWDLASLAGAELQVEAREFNRQRNNYCAQKMEVSVAEFVDANVAAVQTQLAEQGWQLGDDSARQYREFMAAEKPGEWRFESRPAEPIGLENFSDWEQISDWLRGLQLITQFADGLADPLQINQIESTLVVDPLDNLPQEQVTVSRQVSLWEEVTFSDLALHVGRPVRVTSTGQNQYDGYLERLTDDSLVVATRIPGGMAEIPIPRNKLLKVQIIPRR